MLEFLGLEADALKVFIGALIIGAAFAPAVGILSGNKKSKAAPVLFGLAIAVTLVALFLCAGPIFILFITFQWLWLILPLLAALALCALLSLFFYAVTVSRRKAKYKKNPVIKEIAEYCRSNQIAGVQCFRNCVRYFTFLPNSAYCKTEIIRKEAKNNIMISNFENNDNRPDHWKEYDQSVAICGYIQFSDRGYPDLEDINMFAKALASRIGGCKVAYHEMMYAYTKHYFAHQTQDGVPVNEHNKIYKHRDCLVYTKRALANAKKRDKAAKAAAPKEKKADTPKWE